MSEDSFWRHFIDGHLVLYIRHITPFTHKLWDAHKVLDRYSYVDNIIQLEFLSTFKFHIYRIFNVTLNILTFIDRDINIALLNVYYIILYVSNVLWRATVY